jgi:hypothetical protein
MMSEDMHRKTLIHFIRVTLSRNLKQPPLRLSDSADHFLLLALFHHEPHALKLRYVSERICMTPFIYYTLRQ